MFVAADALFAHLGRIDLAAAAPAPAHGAQVVTAGGLVTHGANDAICQGAAAGLAPSQAIFFVANVAKFYGHRNCELWAISVR